VRSKELAWQRLLTVTLLSASSLTTCNNEIRAQDMLLNSPHDTSQICHSLFQAR